MIYPLSLTLRRYSTIEVGIKLSHGYQQPKSSQKKLRGRMYEMRKQGHGGQLPKGIPQNEGSLSTAEIVAKETTDAAASELIEIPAKARSS